MYPDQLGRERNLGSRRSRDRIAAIRRETSELGGTPRERSNGNVGPGNRRRRSAVGRGGLVGETQDAYKNVFDLLYVLLLYASNEKKKKKEKTIRDGPNAIECVIGKRDLFDTGVLSEIAR